VKLTPSRTRLLRFAATALLLGVFGVGAFSLVLERLASVNDALSDATEVAENTTDEFVPQGCDFVADIAECPESDPLDVSSLEGAVERYRNGVFASSDARFLVLSEEDYRILLEPVFGPAEVQEGDVVFDVPVWEASFGELDRSETFSWEQQWQLVGGAGMFEQIFVLARTEDAEEFLANHKAFMLAKGVKPVTHPATGDARMTSLPLLFRFVDVDTDDPARRCVNRALAVLDRVVFSVTLMTGGDCSTPDPSLPAGVVGALRERAEAILIDR
jgi:hypothetical protein